MRKFSRFIALVITLAGILGSCQGPAIAAELDGTGIIYLPSLVDEKTEQADGRQYLIKTYEAAPEYGDGYSELIEEPFEQDGLLYTFQYASFNDVMKTDRKWERDEVNFPVDNEDLSPVFQRLEPSIPYAGEDGYAGTLDLDRGAVWVQIMAYTNKSYTLTDTVTLAGLSSNDTSNIPKTREKSGVTMTLESVDWTVQESTNIGYDTVPTKYTATAHYSGAYSKKVPSEYLARAWYGGYVTKASVEKIVYTVTYAAELPVENTAEVGLTNDSVEVITPESVSDTASDTEASAAAEFTPEDPSEPVPEVLQEVDYAEEQATKGEITALPDTSEESSSDVVNPQAPENMPAQIGIDENQSDSLNLIIAGIIAAAILAAAVFFFNKYWFNVAVYTGGEGEFRQSAKRRVSVNNPVVDLRHLRLDGGKVTIWVKAAAATALYGKQIKTVIDDDHTFSNNVNKRNKDFRYVIDIPGGEPEVGSTGEEGSDT